MELLQNDDFSQPDKCVLCLASEDPTPLQVSDVREVGESAGCRSISQWNVSRALSGSNGRAVRTDQGWELTEPGRNWVVEVASEVTDLPDRRLVSRLRQHAEQIESEQTQDFVDEAIRCYELGLNRAAVVLSWVGAVGLLQDHIVDNKLAEFNKEARGRDSSWTDAKTRDDLAEMKEYTFLHVLQSISVIGKSMKQELQTCRRLRNGCGHPNDLRVGEARVEAHLEVLIDNVFSQF